MIRGDTRVKLQPTNISGRPTSPYMKYDPICIKQ